MVCKALTVVEEAEHVPQDAKAILDWVLGLVGKVKYLSRYSFASGSLMTELSMAMIANVLDGIYVAAEINRLHGQTLELEADMLEGLLAMMRAGYDPRTVRFLTISSNHYVDEVLESITNRGAGRGLFYNKLTAVLYHMHSLETQSSDLRFEKERSAHEKEVNGSASKECVL
ncbi:hypothetical protein BJY04DRAFT_200402, partial [Aspergillus karnatakaensis]|uniref:pyrroline-5-carboxylate reductase n=1 Tax=Aspergillus karnatakaensis TaxID=1810916 RepID=UPI003CCE44EB